MPRMEFYIRHNKYDFIWLNHTISIWEETHETNPNDCHRTKPKPPPHQTRSIVTIGEQCNRTHQFPSFPLSYFSPVLFHRTHQEAIVVVPNKERESFFRDNDGSFLPSLSTPPRYFHVFLVDLLWMASLSCLLFSTMAKLLRELHIGNFKRLNW